MNTFVEPNSYCQQDIQVTSLRLVCERKVPFDGKLLTASSVFELMQPLVSNLAQEAFYVVGLNIKNQVNVIHFASLGGGSSVNIDLTVVLKALLLSDSSGSIIVHNHPSGDPEPSDEDKSLTERIAQVLKLLGIRFLDHVIIGDLCFYSFAEKAMMPKCN